MAKPNSRTTLKQYCLRQLGHPVIEINVDEDQLDDRIDEALQYYQEYHFDGTERIFLKHQITSDDITNKYIPISDAVIGVNKVLPFNQAGSTVNMFDVRYQLHLNDLYDLSSTSLVNYDMAMRHVSLLENLFNQAPMFRFNRHMDRLYLDIDWSNDELRVDDYVVVDAYRILDPDTYTDVYNDMFLKKYTTALFKKQWGANLIKFEGMQLPGGITLNGRQLFDDATQEIQQIEEDMQLRYQLPDDFMIG